MRKITVFDRIEDIFMEADAEVFAQLEERIATIKRLRKLDRKPKKQPTGHYEQTGTFADILQEPKQ